MRADDCERPENAEQASPVAPAKPQFFMSLQRIQELSPDYHYDSTVDNLQALYGADETDPIWTLDPVGVALIDPSQLMDDPSDDEAHAKVESIRETMRTGGHIPPVYVIHEPSGQHPYTLIEGRHRYNAAYREDADTIGAWVGHPDCGCRGITG